ncbi:MAG: ATP-binding cassette domain-containing protein [Saprospiraceae bacterium]|nr:ATP-binding cassette domain-containing protein [Saprospiraceae bacterium]
MDILIDNLTKSYGPQRAVDNISFEVKTGEILGFLGPNGAGKTTTMKMITNYLPSDHGRILIDGQNVSDGSMRRHIGYLPENNPLYDEMQVLDYLAFCAELQDVQRAEISDRIKEMVRLCGLDAEKHKRISELSKGYRQRVGLAQAMIHDPEVLVLDEPTSGLDPNQIVEIRELIRRLGREKTVILSTHILPEVEATCDRILIINQGAIVADGTSKSLRSQSKGQQVLRVRIEGADPSTVVKELHQLTMVSMVDLIDDVLEIQSKEGQSANVPIFDLCVARGWKLVEMTPLETKLEDIFRDLTLN